MGKKIEALSWIGQFQPTLKEVEDAVLCAKIARYFLEHRTLSWQETKKMQEAVFGKDATHFGSKLLSNELEKERNGITCP
jgi:hypothetical protein